MPAFLNAQPVGLLDFLGIKNGGEYPQQLATTLAPTLELLALYEANSQKSFGQVGPGALGAGASLWGPAGATSAPGSVFHFDSVGIQVNGTGVGASWYGSLGLYYGAAGIYVPFTDGQYAFNPGPPGNVTLSMRDVWCPAGWALAVNTYQLAGAPTFTGSWLASVYRF